MAIATTAGTPLIDGDTVELREMSNKSRRLLDEDVKKWGSRCLGMTRHRVTEITGLAAGRVGRLHSWIIRYGLKSPLSDEPATPQQAVPVEGETGPQPTASKGVHILVVGDCHAAPGQDYRRFRWLARQVAALRPTHFFQMGDWYSLDSLCRHSTFLDRTKERLVEDLRAGGVALDIFEHELALRAPGWQPDVKAIFLGNHDDRASSLANDQPWLEGVVNVGAAHESHGWKVVPFLEPFRLAGCRFQHFLKTEGGKGVISGKYHSRRLLERTKYESVFVGHSHRLDMRVETDHRGRRSWGIVAGCYLEHHEPYAAEDNQEWWRGNLELIDVKDGDFDVVTWSMNRIQRTFGD